MSVGIIGPMFELAATRGQLELRARSASTMGSRRSRRSPTSICDESLAGQEIRTVLRRQGYYYAQAVLPSADLDARYGRFRLSWPVAAANTGRSTTTIPTRASSRIGFHCATSELRTAATLAIQPDRGPFRLALEVVNAFWDSTLPGRRFTAREQTIGAMILAGW